MRRTREATHEAENENQRWFRQNVAPLRLLEDGQPRRAALAVRDVVQAEIRLDIALYPYAILSFRLYFEINFYPGPLLISHDLRLKQLLLQLLQLLLPKLQLHQLLLPEVPIHLLPNLKKGASAPTRRSRLRWMKLSLLVPLMMESLQRDGVVSHANIPPQSSSNRFRIPSSITIARLVAFPLTASHAKSW